MKNSPEVHYNRESERISHLGGATDNNNKITYNTYKNLSPAKRQLIQFDNDRDSRNLANLIKMVANNQYMNGETITQGAIDVMTL